MVPGDAFGLFIGAVVLGAIHGLEPGHGWPVAASYALDQSSKWLYGFAASLILGIGHLISSITMVAIFFYAKEYFNLTQLNEPITILETIQLGGPVSLVAGLLLIALGIREYTHGHSHSHEDHDDHGEDSDPHHSPNHDRSHEHAQSPGQDTTKRGSRLKEFLPFVGGHSHSQDRLDEPADRDLLGIAWFAFLLGFAHEEGLRSLHSVLDRPIVSNG